MSDNVNSNGWLVNFDGAGFTNAFCCVPVPAMRIVIDPMGDHLLFPAGQSFYDVPRKLLLDWFGKGGIRSIAPVKADGYCAYGAAKNFNAFYEAEIGPGLQAGLAALQTWLGHDEIVADLYEADKYHDKTNNPVFVLKVSIRCDENSPIGTVHLLRAGRALPDCSPLTLFNAIRLVADHDRPILVLYDFENHPAVGGFHGGRHFEVMIPTKKFFTSRTKEAEQKRSRQEKHEKSAKEQADGYEKAAKMSKRAA